MSSDNFHLIVQLPNRKWKATQHSIAAWQEAQNKSDYAIAKRMVRSSQNPTFTTLNEALDYAEAQGNTRFGKIVIDYEDYYD